MSAVFAFEVTVAGKPSWGQVVNARTRGQAKAEYHAMVTDAWPDVPFTALRCRKLGAPKTSPQFIRNAEYRGMASLRCGDQVKVGKGTGVIVGHNESANFEVLFDPNSEAYAGARLSVHPSSIVRSVRA